MKSEIIANLKEYHARQGVSFLSEEDAMDYYAGLVELIEALINKHRLMNAEEIISRAEGKARYMRPDNSAPLMTHDIP